jgi:hypothetical protein
MLEECRLRVFEKMVLRKIFGRKSVTSSSLLFSPCMLHALPNSCRILVVKLQGNRPFGRPRRRWKDYVKMNLREIGWGGMDWIGLDQDRNRWKAFVNTVMYLQVP